MGLAAYDIQGSGKSWSIFHDGKPEGDYETSEAAFEAAVAAASLALRQGHDVRVTVKGESALDVEPLSSLMRRQS
ncbi:MAG: hypothetical protein IAF94_19155 [Pirellulaceae bacterium]|nr:hypothetical protein [Pirellulaceae bacterium]